MIKNIDKDEGDKYDGSSSVGNRGSGDIILLSEDASHFQMASTYISHWPQE